MTRNQYPRVGCALSFKLATTLSVMLNYCPDIDQCWPQTATLYDTLTTSADGEGCGIA